MRGRPSAWWRAGQDRRMALIEAAVPQTGARALDLGCGLGAYTRHMAAAGALAVGLEVELPRAIEARVGGISAACGVGEALPFPDAAFDLVLLHEVLEHVMDDHATMREVSRVLAPGGRAVIFVPNRLWPFETHGTAWRGHYRPGNAPLVNYLPDPLRNRLAPHVRVYTRRGLIGLVKVLPLTVVSLTEVFPGYDRLIVGRPRLGAFLRRTTYALEATPLGRFGLSHVMVVERT